VDGRTVAVLGLAALCGCDTVDVGRPPAESGPPIITRILVEDAVTQGIIDLLDTAPPAACDDAHPCPGGPPNLAATCLDDSGAEASGAGASGHCQSPTAADRPAAVGAPGSLMIRVVLSGLLDASAVETSAIPDGGGAQDRLYALRDPGAVRLVLENGGEVPLAQRYWDPSGSNHDTLDPFYEPLGPAIVAVIGPGLSPERRYRVLIDPSSLTDAGGAAITSTTLGPLDPGGYPFTTGPAAP